MKHQWPKSTSPPQSSLQQSKVSILNNQDKIGSQNYIKTPPKTTAAKSVHDYESQERRSYDGSSMSPYKQNGREIMMRGLTGKRTEQF